MNFEEFEALKPEEQEKIFHERPFREKGDLLLHSHDPLALARSMSAEELYLMVKEVDLEEKSEILRFATMPQLFFISDVDCWKKDRLHTKGFIEWLQALLAADEMKCIHWLLQMDYETVVTGLKKVAQVLKPDREWAADELLGDTPYFTLDDQYYILGKEEDLETVRRVFELLYENQRGKYFAFLEGIMAELDDELEEDAYRHRENRLSERGFPDYETAHQLYRPITRKEFDEFPLKETSVQAQGTASLKHSGMPLPNYPVLWSVGRLFLDEVLVLFQEDSGDAGMREKLEEELAWLSNKVIAADGIDFSSEERVRRGIERARAFVSIGLEELSGQDLIRAGKILRERWLETVFRWGMTPMSSLREKAMAVVREEWKGDRVLFLEFLNSPYDKIMNGLLLSVPQFHDTAAEKDDFAALRDFRSLDEIVRSGQAVEQVARVHEILNSRFSSCLQSWKKEREKGNSGITLFSVLGTLFAEFVLNETATGFKPAPAFKPDRLKEFMGKAFDLKGERRFLKPEWKEKFERVILRPAPEGIVLRAEESKNEILRPAQDDAARLKPIFSLVFDEIEDDFSRIDPVTLDPRFISSLCLSLQSRPLTGEKSAKDKERKSYGRSKKKTRSRS